MQRSGHAHRAEFYTDLVCVSASFQSRHRRLSDSLNALDERFVLLHEANVSPIRGPAPWLAARVQDFQLELGAVRFVVEVRDARTPTADPAVARVRKDVYLAWFLAPPFWAQGHIHLAEGGSAIDFMFTLPQRFIPITRASYQLVSESASPTSVDFLAINKQLVQAAYQSQPGSGAVEQETLQGVLDAGVQAARAGNQERARQLLLKATEMEPRSEMAWLWLSSVTQDPAEIVGCMRKVVEINPSHQKAREIVRLADGSGLAAAGSASPSAAPAGAPAIPAPSAPRATPSGDAAPTASPKLLPTRVGPAPTGAGEHPMMGLGQYLVKAGLISREQLRAALDQQAQWARAGVSKRLGDVVIEMGFLTAGALASVLARKNADFNEMLKD